MSGPCELVLYQDERHGIAGGPAAMLGPNRDEVVVDWLVDRLAGTPMESRLRYVSTAGTVTSGPLARP
jgi:hypothetical protein